MLFILISVEIQTINSEPQPFRFPPTNLKQKHDIVDEFSTSNLCFSILHQYLDILKLPEKTLQTNFFSFFKHNFHKKYRLCLFYQGRHRKSSSSLEVFDGRFVDLCFSHSLSPQSEISKKCYCMNSVEKIGIVKEY